MADEEAEQDLSPDNALSDMLSELKQRFQELHKVVETEHSDSPVQSSSQYCKDFCWTLQEYASRWKVEEGTLPLVEVYILALLSYAQASPYLSLDCENVPLVAERLSSSFVELVLSLKDIPDALWEKFKSSVQFAHSEMQKKGLSQLSHLSVLGQYDGVWTNNVLQGILSNQSLQSKQVEEFLLQEGQVLLEMRVKQLMKEKRLEESARLAKMCSDCSFIQRKGPFKQMYLVCLCSTCEQSELMEELSKEDCREALEMICNLESDGDEMAAFILCSAFLTRQLLQGETYCAWELTLFWSKLLKRLEPSEQAFLDKCRQISQLSKTVYHILFFIKVIQSEIDNIGLHVCIEMCIRALQMESDANTKATVCKTISSLLPTDLEVKRACQLTEFLLEPTVDSYYAVETIYTEPDQKLEEEKMPIPNSLRCELLLVFKTLWPFDPEFWNWKALKRHCLELMGEEASIVSSIDLLNDTESPEEEEDPFCQEGFQNFAHHSVGGPYELTDVPDRREKNRKMKKMRESGFISSRFRNWQAYMQYCVLCDKEFLGHRIVRHAQTHLSCGLYHCPICAKTFSSKDTLIPHVTSHVKQSSKERLTALKTNKKLAHLKLASPEVAHLQIKTENKPDEQRNNLGQHDSMVNNVPMSKDQSSRDVFEENVCPIGHCRRNFKFFRNLIAHVKTHGDSEEVKTFLEMQKRKVICQYCRRHFVNVTHLNDHLQVHCGVKPYICIQLNCNASFLSNSDLFAHRKTHSVFQAQCMFPNCGKIFTEAFRLYEHEAHHYKTSTCKVGDCGMIFHSQKQLELHQDEHNTKKNNAASEHTSQSIQTAPPPIDQMLLKHASQIQDDYKIDWSTEHTVNPDHGKLQVSIESFQKSSEASIETPGDQSLLSQTESGYSSSQTQILHPSVIQVMNPHMPGPNRQGDSLVGGHFDHITSPKQRKPTHCLESSLDYVPLRSNSCVLQGQPQILLSNVNNDSMNYYNNSMSLSGQQLLMHDSNLFPVALPQNSEAPSLSQLLLPSVTPQTITRKIRPKSMSCSATTGHTEEGKQRFHCPSELCTRHYSAYKSVTKHMKTAHPDFYVEWKCAKTKIRTTCTPAQRTSLVGHLSTLSSAQNQHSNQVPLQEVQRQNVIQSPFCTDVDLKYSTLPSESSATQTQNASILMGNLSHPILSHQGTDASPLQLQTPVLGCQNSASQHTQSFNFSQIHPSNIQMMPQFNSDIAPLTLNVPSSSMMGITVDRTATFLQPPLIENGPQSALPLGIDGAKEVLLQVRDNRPGYTSDMQGNLSSGTKTATDIFPNHLQSVFPSSDSASQKIIDKHPQNCLVIPETQKKARISKRTKWPAIIKDGKFACSRCFRQFNCSKSLGGHLSRGTNCKPYEQGQVTDMPTSFLDMLKSEPTAGTAQLQLSYNHGPVYLEQPSQSVTKLAPSTSFPQDNTVYDNGESCDDILKQIMAESNIADLFEHTSTVQSLLQNPSVSYDDSECLQGSSVLTQSENVPLKTAEGQDDTSRGTALYPGFPITPGRNEFPDRLFSPIIPDNFSTNCLDIGLSNQLTHAAGQGYPSESTIKSPDTDVKQILLSDLLDGQLGPSTSIRQAVTHKNTNENDVKKRLREQILAGDFQRRNNLCVSDNTDPNANSEKLTTACQLSVGPCENGLDHLPSNARYDSFIQGVNQHNSETRPDTSGKIMQPLNMQSFTYFREPSTLLQDTLSPEEVSENVADQEPKKLSASQLQSMTEIQSAFEKLNLVKEITSMNQTCDALKTPPVPAKVPLCRLVSSPCPKPFACEVTGCTFSSTSSEALWRHLSKTHSYTPELVNGVKKRYGLYAPFKCQKCCKTFTRNSNLRTHYLSAHKLSVKEVADLDMKRRQAKAAESPHLNRLPVLINQAPVTQIKVLSDPTLMNRSQIHLSPRVVIRRDLSSHPLLTQKLMDVSKKNDNCSSSSYSLQAANMPNQLPTQQTQASTQNTVQPLLSNKISIKSPTEKSRINTTTKSKDKANSNDAMASYRPYRCVHQGCVAAFTIQHNLMLHYRAVHQSALLALGVNKEQEQNVGLETKENKVKQEAEVFQISEFRCQVKDCSRVFQEVSNLLQHYLRLHEFSLDDIRHLLSSIELGLFTCGHQGCTVTFTSLSKYIGHVREHHKDIKLDKPQQANVPFKCEVEGCDRSYSTKSNLLRHTIKKHQEPQAKLKKTLMKEDETKQNTFHFQITKTCNGKENIEGNKKNSRRERAKKRVVKSKTIHWAEYKKPSLKSKAEASAMCVRKFPLQYPCMLKGCKSVMKSERSIFKHYMGHGLTEKCLEQQRSHFIFCKKVPRQKCQSLSNDDSKSENASDSSDIELSADTILEEEKREYSESVLYKRNNLNLTDGYFEGSLSNEESSDSSKVLKCKGRTRKRRERKWKRKKIPRLTKIDIVYSKDDDSDSSPAVLPDKTTEQTAPLASFKPMGFEMSFLKFLEQSNKTESGLKRKADVPETWKKTGDICVRFKNCQNVKTGSRVKIIIDAEFSSVSDSMLKQLQTMQNTVALIKMD